MPDQSILMRARDRRRRALASLSLREMSMGLMRDRNRPQRLTFAAAQRLMQRLV
jgi:hypothetical protein